MLVSRARIHAAAEGADKNTDQIVFGIEVGTLAIFDPTSVRGDG